MSEPFLGQICMFAFPFAPKGWALCDGQLLLIHQNPALYSLLGIRYGGDGITTFALPDLRGRAPLHQGSGSGLTPRTLGDSGGEEEVSLTVDTLPAHTHEITPKGVNTIATDPLPTGAVFAKPASNRPIYENDLSGEIPVDMLPFQSGSSGENASHSNMQPYLVINFCIALVGIYPLKD